MKNKTISIVLIIALISIFMAGCVDKKPQQAQSDSGVQKTSVSVTTGTDGLTTEQRNIKDRLIHDNKPGAMGYLYVFSSLSGQIMYSDVVKGKVTSSGKRLTPRTVTGQDGQRLQSFYPMPVIIGGTQYLTNEVIEDDGTYGDSIGYLYYWDTKGIYHQIYVSGGQMVVVTDEPMSMNSVTMNVEATNTSK